MIDKNTLYNRIEKTSILLEKEYDELKRKREDNRRLYEQLRKINSSLQKEVREKETALRDFLRQVSARRKEGQREEIRRIEQDIAGGFAHRIRNNYDPAVLLMDKLKRDGFTAENDQGLTELFNLLKIKLPRWELKKAIPLVQEINGHHKTIEEIFRIASKSLERNCELLNNFLDYSSFEKKKIPVDMDGIIRAVIRKNALLLKKEAIGVRTDLNLQKELLGDHEQYFCLMENLLLNSCNALQGKRPKKGKRIVIRTFPEDKKNRQVGIEVEDNGPGFDSEKSGKLFDLFFTTDKKNGTGLGLPLCRKIVEMYNGRITFESKPDFRTIFRVNLPGQEHG